MRPEPIGTHAFYPRRPLKNARSASAQSFESTPP
jgi:hypothetical protein